MLARFGQARSFVKHVAHARAGVDHDDGSNRSAAVQAKSFAENRRLPERQANERYQRHAQEQQEQVPQAILLIDLPLLLEETEGRERHPLRLLPHDEVQQDRQADDCGPVRIDSGDYGDNVTDGLHSVNAKRCPLPLGRGLVRLGFATRRN